MAPFGHPERMPLLADPVTPNDRRLLRAAVLDLVTNERRRSFPSVLHVGTPGGRAACLVDDRSWDHALRTEIVGALLRSLDDPPWVWLTRTGTLTTQDVDLAWLAATVAAARERGADPAFVVVTRHGWRDPRTDTTREWRRIRRR